MCVEPPFTSSEYLAWKRLDNYVCACLNATLHPSIAHHAIGATTAQDLWLILETMSMSRMLGRSTPSHFSRVESQFSPISFKNVAYKNPTRARSHNPPVSCAKFVQKGVILPHIVFIGTHLLINVLVGSMVVVHHASAMDHERCPMVLLHRWY